MASREVQRRLERLVGAVIVPQVRVAGTYAGQDRPIVPAPEYLRRFPPRMVVAFGRRPGGPLSPTPELEQVREGLAEHGEPPPLVACDLEEGAGLHFAEGTHLPPAAALAAASAAEGDSEAGLEWIRRAGELTSRQARALGVDLVLAPVVDVHTRRENPIIAVRSFGSDPARVGRRAAALVEGLRHGGVLACAKHFPGHGDTDQDSHRQLPLVPRSVAELHEIELRPYRQLTPDAVMVGHLDVPALSGEPGLPATFSRRIVTDLLRGELGFGGVVLTDAMEMGALEALGRPCTRALLAGCNGLLAPGDPLAAAEELLEALESQELSQKVLARAAEPMVRLAQERSRKVEVGEGARAALRDEPEARELAAELARRGLCPSPTWPGPVASAGEWELLPPFPPLPEDRAGAVAQLLAPLARPGSTARTAVIPVALEARAFHGRSVLTGEEVQELERRLANLAREGRDPRLLWLAHPMSLPAGWWDRPAAPVLVAFAPHPGLIEASARVLAGDCRPGGSLDKRPG